MDFIRLFWINITNPIILTVLIINCVFLVILSTIDIKLLGELYEINYKNLEHKKLRRFSFKIIKKLTIAIILSSIIVIFFSPIYLKNEYTYIVVTFLCTFVIYRNILCKSIERFFAKKTRANKLLFSKNLEDCLENIREFKSNFAAILQNIGKEINDNNFEELKVSYKKIISEYKEINTNVVVVPESINESAVYNLVCNKISLAKDFGIEVNIDAEMDFTKLKIKSYELVRIIGILLDNAIEAAKDCNQKHIDIYFLYSKNKSVIKISNTYENNEEIDMDKIFARGYTTKAGNTGLGLWEIRRILEKRSNLDLYTYKDKNIFNQELYIYNK